MSSSPQSEPQPIAALPDDAAPRGVAGAFRAFRHRNYRLFFIGQLTSLIGTWMQNVAQGWLVRDLAPADERAFYLGLVGFLGSIPMLLFAVLGGVIADRVPKRRVILFYQLLAIMPALALATLTGMGAIQLWQIAALAFLLGSINAFDIPARQSFIVEMVGKGDLPNAIALNSAIFNSARLLGPFLAGMIIAAFPSVTSGAAACFFFNSASFVASIVALSAMRKLPPATSDRAESVWRATRQGLNYISQSRAVAALMVLVAVMAAFGWMYSVLMPVFAGDILHLDSRGFGMLVSANGIGALSGALTLAVVADRFRPRRLLFSGIAVYCVSVSVFGWSQQTWLSAVALVGTGWGLVTFFATANTAIQRRVPDELRGRVMSLYMLVFGGLSPFGSLLAGVLAKQFNAPFVAFLGAGVCALSAIIISRLAPPTKFSSELG